MSDFLFALNFLLVSTWNFVQISIAFNGLFHPRNASDDKSLLGGNGFGIENFIALFVDHKMKGEKEKFLINEFLMLVNLKTFFIINTHLK